LRQSGLASTANPISCSHPRESQILSRFLGLGEIIRACSFLNRFVIWIARRVAKSMSFSAVVSEAPGVDAKSSGFLSHPVHTCTRPRKFTAALLTAFNYHCLVQYPSANLMMVTYHHENGTVEGPDRVRAHRGSSFSPGWWWVLRYIVLQRHIWLLRLRRAKARVGVTCRSQRMPAR